MTRTPLVTFLVALFLASGVAVASDDGLEAKVARFLKANCVRCHGAEVSKGDMTLDEIRFDFRAGHDFERWERVLDRLEGGDMPPADEPRPDEAERRQVVEWIEAQLGQSTPSVQDTASAPTARRLTNMEYQNTIRDLLGFELDLIDNLPEDPVKPYHFNNTAEFMLIGPEQMDRYAENARRAMASAIVDPGEPEVYKTSRVWNPLDPPERGMQYDEVGVYGNRRNTAASGMGLKGWPKTGEFRIRIEAAAILPPGYQEAPLRLVMGYSLDRNSSMLQMRPVGTLILRNTVDDLQVFEFRGRIENHPEEPGQVTSRGQQPPKMHITPQNLFDDGRLNDQLDPLSVPRVVLRSLEFESPVFDTWPPEHHTRILFDSPPREGDPEAYVRQVLDRFLSRAFRRPASPGEIDRFAQIYDIFAADSPTFEQAMRETLAMVLISPQFLYHTEARQGVTTHQYELASKLSYFLWGSMPDEELFQLAAQGRLDDPQVIEQQVARLLADPRSQSFLNSFATQWLSIEKMKSVAVNRNLFPRFLYYVSAGERAGTEVPYRPTIRDYMHEETVGFLGELIRTNASVLNIVASDFAYLNEPLAAHYGVSGVQGIELRRVPIQPEDPLGGLLTQGSILVANSTGSAPHPIYRAVWLREAILGDEVKPPPAEVPALSDSAGETAETAVSIKDLLAAHRQVESCNDCHARLDPWGIPFEHYNAVGRYQPRVPKDGTRVRGFNPREDKSWQSYQDYLDALNTVAVEADAQLPDGSTVDGMRELKAYLLEHHQDAIVENVIRRLLTYGIGRELTYRDRSAVERLIEQSRDQNHGLRDMIVAICQSETFRGIPIEEN